MAHTDPNANEYITNVAEGVLGVIPFLRTSGEGYDL